jgi:hypothetical protein
VRYKFCLIDYFACKGRGSSISSNISKFTFKLTIEMHNSQRKRERPAALSESIDDFTIELEGGLFGGADFVRAEEEAPLPPLPVGTCLSGRTDILEAPPADAMETLQIDD